MNFGSIAVNTKSAKLTPALGHRHTVRSSGIAGRESRVPAASHKSALGEKKDDHNAIFNAKMSMLIRHTRI